MVSYNNVGDVLLAQGDAAGTLAEYRASLAIAETLAAKRVTDRSLPVEAPKEARADGGSRHRMVAARLAS